MNYAALARWASGRPEEGMRDLVDLDFIQATHFEARLLVRVEDALIPRASADAVEAALDHPMLETHPETLPLIGGWVQSYGRWRAARLQDRAARLLAKEKLEEGMASLDLAAEFRPDDAALREALAQARRKVLRDLLKRMKKDKAPAELTYKAGRLHLLLGDADSARDCLAAWLEMQASDKTGPARDYLRQDVERMLCDAELCRGNPKKALACLEAVDARDLRDSYSLYLAGKCRVHLGERAAALSLFEQLLDREPSFARFRLRRLMQPLAQAEKKA